MVNDYAIIKKPRKYSASIDTTGKENSKQNMKGHTCELAKTSRPKNLYDLRSVPEISENLISFSKFCDSGYRAFFANHSYNLYDKTEIIGKGIRYKNLYKIMMIKPIEMSEIIAQVTSTGMRTNSFNVWHKCFGHLTKRML